MSNILLFSGILCHAHRLEAPTANLLLIFWRSLSATYVVPGPTNSSSKTRLLPAFALHSYLSFRVLWRALFSNRYSGCSVVFGEGWGGPDEGLGLLLCLFARSLKSDCSASATASLSWSSANGWGWRVCVSCNQEWINASFFSRGRRTGPLPRGPSGLLTSARCWVLVLV